MLFSWRQLTQVTIFYIAFVFLFALIGVHIIGGLDHICVYDNKYTINIYHLVTY